MNDAHLEAGQRLGEWVLERPLGRGGYGEVWAARHNALPERVAIKVPHDRELAARLRREGLLQAGVRGPHVVGVLGLDPEHDPPYLVTELVEGRSLRALIAAGPTPPAEAQRLLREIAAGLETVHAAGVVHRDLKPENVLLDGAGQVRIADFGLGLAREEATHALLSGSLRSEDAPALAGTLRYMAPEQRDAEAEVDQRADLYALGVILFELLTGEAPCGAELPSDVVPGLDARWDALFRQLCARLPTRLASTTAAREALDAIAAAPEALVADDPVEVGAARSVDVPAGLAIRAVAFAIDLLPFVMLAMGPLKVGRGFAAVAAFVIYDVLAVTFTGRTVGKWLCGLRVADLKGGRPDPTQGFQRETFRIASLGLFGIGYVTELIPERRSLHDLAADTQVVHVT